MKIDKAVNLLKKHLDYRKGKGNIQNQFDVDDALETIINHLKTTEEFRTSATFNKSYSYNPK